MTSSVTGLPRRTPRSRKSSISRVPMPSAADAGDQMQLAQMQPTDEFVDLYPADILAPDANDSRV